ncbi:MAG: ABC transporter ATP-binding protein [bacterium]|nr:ABC transporter ATP-binding protein [bacterium]
MRLGPGRFRHLEEDTKPSNPWASLRRVLPWLTPYWPLMLAGLSCMLITTYLSQQPPRIIQYAVDTIIGRRQYEQIYRVILLFTGIYLGMQLFGFLRTYWLHIGGQSLLHRLRVQLYEHLQRLPLTYYDSRQTGDLMSRMTGDVGEIELLMVHGLDVFIMGLCGMFLALYYIQGYHPLLALLVLLPVPLIAAGIFFFSRSVRKIYRSIRDYVGSLNARLQDNISGIRVVKAFSREREELDRVSSDSRQVMDMNIRGIRMWSAFGPAMGFMGNIGSVLLLGAGIHLVQRGLLTSGELVASLFYVSSFYQPIGNLFQVFDSLQRSLAAAERLLEVLDTVPEISDPEAAVPLADVQGQVEFRNVSFHYSTGIEILRNINLLARPGQRIALVGRSGAGKTSFINLIPRFYDVAEGQVLIDNTDVRLVKQEELRRHIATVLQETFLFNGTVRENLRYGRPEASEDDLTAAAETANAHEFIVRLPGGYDTEIGERGVKLSGGQKQRLAIARAVLADPRILILDEATSSVDSESEFLIHQALERLMNGRTTFIIAHRLSTIRNADLILVLDEGTVVEQGTHSQLLQADNRYARMYHQQFWLDEMFGDTLT